MTVQEWLGQDNQLGIDIWKNKYQYNDESFDHWLDRVSNGNTELRDLIVSKKFLFGGRILSNRGLYKEGVKSTYSNCYVISPPEDNIESIYECATKLARTYSYGGGCGVDISNLAPRGAKVNNSAKETSGAVSFMDLYNLTTELIGQNGRRGALMLSLACNHPDLEEFISIKTDLNKINKANISIKIFDEFMECVKHDRDFCLSFTRNETNDTITKMVNARKIFKKMCEANWDYAEPGMLFWDRIEDWNLLSDDPEFAYAGTNPCAEEPLPAGGSCLLGSINLSEFVINGRFDFDEFARVVHIAVRALNEVLDEGLDLHPLQEQKDSVRNWRQIGLGIFGLADALIKMKITYGSDASLRVCNKISHTLIKEAIRESSNLANIYGAYPNYHKENVLNSSFFKTNIFDTQIVESVEKYGLCNSQLLTIAPTGSLSSMLGVSGGIEPIFANSYERKTQSLHDGDVYYKVYTPIVKEYMTKNGISDDNDLPEYFITARDINWKNRIEMQSIWQGCIDASISSTVNVPNEFTVEDVMDLYQYAWEAGLKGVTIFREGCKRGAVLVDSKSTTETNSDETKLERGEVIKVSDDCIGKKRTLHTGCGTLHCEAFFDPNTGDLLETYLSKGSAGGCNNFMIGLSRLISLSARGGIGIDKIIDQLHSSGTCPSYAVRTATKRDTSKGSSCPVAVSYALRDMYDEMQRELKNKSNDVEKKVEAKNNATQEHTGPTCPTCGDALVFECGCSTCKSCGYSKCD